jgi:medium-chain acyl-[acyl-carrier-protein] hydrolase
MKGCLMPEIWREQFTVRAYEVGVDAALTMQSVCNYLQESAGNHAYQLGAAVTHLLQKNLTWVLSRLHVQMKRYPLWRETVEIKTWPADVAHLFAVRDFELCDRQNHLIGTATTSWMVLDIKQRKPVAIPENIRHMHADSPGRAIADKFDTLPVMKHPQFEKIFHVRLSDLDVNRHVNNVNYIEWALETIPEEIWQTCFLSDLEIGFRAESNFGDRIISYSESQDEGKNKIVIHQLYREEDKRELARLRTLWVPADQEALK